MLRLAVPLALLVTASVSINLIAQVAAESERDEALASADAQASAVDAGLAELAGLASADEVPAELAIEAEVRVATDDVGGDLALESTSPDVVDRKAGSEQEERVMHVEVSADHVIQDQNLTWHTDNGQVYVHKLKNLQAVAVASLVQRMFPTDHLIVDAEERSNSLLIRCAPTTNDRIVALIRELDATTKPSQISPENGSSPKQRANNWISHAQPATLEMHDGDHGDVRIFKFESKTHPEVKATGFLELNSRVTGDLVDQIRRLHDATEPDEKALNELKESLLKQVGQAFEARQELHRAELNVLKEQLAAIDKSIEERDHNKQKIVEKRIDDLLAGNVHVGELFGAAPHGVFGQTTGNWSTDHMPRPGHPPIAPFPPTAPTFNPAGPDGKGTVVIELQGEKPGAVERAKSLVRQVVGKNKEEIEKRVESLNQEAVEVYLRAAEKVEEQHRRAAEAATKSAEAVQNQYERQRRELEEQLQVLKQQLDREREAQRRELEHLQQELQRAQDKGAGQ